METRHNGQCKACFPGCLCLRCKRDGTPRCCHGKHCEQFDTCELFVPEEAEI